MNLKDIKVFIDDTQRTIQRTLDRLTLSREDIRLQMRAARMQNLVLRGDSATSEEIFTADFGTRHPKGLDVTYPDHDQRIVSFDKSERFQVRHENEKANDKRTTYGMAFGEEEVAINDGFYQETDWKKASLKLSGTVAHEHIHCLQAADISNGWEEAMTTVNMTFVIAPVVEDDLEGRVKGIYRDMRRAADHVIKRWEANDLQNIFKVQSSNEFTEGYLAQDCEMQARLHEVLAQGYAIWQQMPATKTELWAALHNCGLRTPDSVMAELRNSEDGQASLKKFAISSSNRAKFDLGSTEQLNEVFNYAALPERRDILWKHVYPNLYGNLLELYGDGPGRERMGLGPNPRAAKALMRQFIHAPDSLTGETLPELVKDIQPENAAQLMNMLIQTSHISEAHAAKATVITSQLLANPEVRDYLNDMPPKTNIDHIRHPLFSAIEAGNSELINIMLDAGVNPLGRAPFEHVLRPGTVETASTAILIKFYKHKQDLINSGSLTPGYETAHVRQKLETMEKGLKTLAENTDKLDLEIPPGNGFEEGQTLREALREAGFEGEKNTLSRNNSEVFSAP